MTNATVKDEACRLFERARKTRVRDGPFRTKKAAKDLDLGRRKDSEL